MKKKPLQTAKALLDKSYDGVSPMSMRMQTFLDDLYHLIASAKHAGATTLDIQCRP